MTGSFTFKPTQDHLLLAFRLHYRRIPIKNLVMFGIFCAVVGAVVSVMTGDTSAKGIFLLSGAIVLYGLVLILVMRTVVTWLWLPRYAKRVFKQQADLRQEIEVQWDEQYFTTRTANSHAQTPWQDFHLWHRGDTVLLLYRSESLFHFLPLDLPNMPASTDQIEGHLLKAGVKRRS